jgi:muramoyltetrapeptide carboxypeptidase
LELLKSALENPETKAVICVRGGYGSMRLIPSLAKVRPPSFKIFVGMSDITALHLFFEKHWHWPTIHGSFTEDKVSPDSIARLKSILFKENEKIKLVGVPLNDLARNEQLIEAKITGGNLCLVQSSIGTLWQLDGRDKIILLEEIGERGYKVDRMLEHLRQANILTSAKAIILGDFLEGSEPDGSSLINQVLERFANGCKIPVIQIAGIGHGYNNLPILLGTKVKLQLGHEIKLFF